MTGETTKDSAGKAFLQPFEMDQKKSISRPTDIGLSRARHQPQETHMTHPHRIRWEREPDVFGYAAAITSEGEILTEATVTRHKGLPVGWDVIGGDGETVVASGYARTVREAKTAAEDEMRRVIIRPVAA